MSDEVSQFLEQVERLRGQQIEDDEMRAREREEFLAAKRERQARREERARSISPLKSSPAHTPSPHSNRRTVHLSEGLRLESPANDALERLQEPERAKQSDSMAYASMSPLKDYEAPADPDSRSGEFSTVTSRGSPLSWQRRPSRPGSRPLSVVATENATQKSLAESDGPDQQSPASPEQSLSKDQIAQSLASKDPSWFRQTADRGAGSAAYRKTQVEDQDRLDMPAVRAQLPGMTAETPKEQPVSRSIRSKSIQGKLASPLPLHPPNPDTLTDRPSTEVFIPQLTGKSSPLRATSPTKGMGGFVQSALMKRSDSVKRWSVASPAGLTRGDLIATKRGSVGPTAPRPRSVIDTTVAPTSGRPVSRHSEKSDKDASFEEPPSEPVPPKTPTRTSPTQARKLASDDDASLPLSPSKTMEPRRWSPIKSSWLESALNRPEVPPKPQPTAPSQPPAWMAELHKPKERPGHRHQVSISGLKTSSPMGAVTTLNPKGLGGIYSPPDQGSGPRTGSLNLVGASSLPASTHVPAPTATTSGPETEQAPTKGRPRDSGEHRSERRGFVAPASMPKSKPVTPPKKDFRANLKPRAPEATSSKTEEPEFKAVFGTLRRAKTQNFKAPDEFKDNIMRGKAALNLTEGPQKSTVKDDFKEAILKKKASFARAKIEGKGIVTNAASAIEKAVPEGLSKRAELGKQMTGKTTDATRSSPESAKRVSPKPVPGPKRICSPINMTARQSAPSLTPVMEPSAGGSSRKPSEAVSSKTVSSKTESSPPSLRSLKTKKSAPSRLGDRFNPSLAGLLARGPPSNAGREETAAVFTVEPSTPGPQLTHMTKNRARGPRRRAPTTPTASVVSLPDMDTDKTSEMFAKAKPERPVKSAHSSFIATADASGQYRFPGDGTEETSSPQQRSRAKGVEDGEGKRSARMFHRRQPTAPERIAVDFSSWKETGDSMQADPPKKLDVKRMSKFLDQGASTSEAKADLKESGRLTHNRTGSWSPAKTERPFPEASAGYSRSVKTPPIPGPRNSTFALADTRDGFTKASPPKPTSPKPTSPRASLAKPPSPRAAVGSPPPGGEVTALLNGFFEAPRQRKEFTISMDSTLNNRPKVEAKIKTMSFHMFQLTADGKQMPIAQHNERVLFEQEMYISSHSFTNEAGWKVREVYFWVGDEVHEESAQEAELLAQREAKSVGGKFLRMKQGKETPEFLQGLGGVAIVRRGSSIKYDSLAPSMLCGRRYMGQVVFDEVDFDTGSLCSGFAYLVVHSGKCWLWKGRGSDVEELSCSRLIGMDLSLTGELMEYDEGSEPETFWEVVGKNGRAHSADHWRLKPSYDKYCCRLFCSDEDARQPIYEISPFNQADVSPYNIYVVDAFFEIYVIVGSRAQSQYWSFRNALEFAQDYAITAASAEDRPFVPVSTVVLEGAPRDLKRVFRKWVEDKCPTVHLGSETGPETGLRRGRSLRVVSLTQALLALKDE